MSLVLDGSSGVLGAQHPRFFHAPEFVSSAGVEAIECARLAGLEPDPWQEFIIHHGLGERPDQRWSAFEVAACLPRQNGKGGVIEIRELAGLFVLEEQLIIHTAHLFDTSKEAQRRLLELIESTPDFDRRVQRVSRSHGEEGIELKGGRRIRFRTRTKGGGRGLTGDCVIFDEAMFLAESSIAALMPTMAARPNPQAWYFGSAVDQMFHDEGIVFARLRERGIRGDDASLAYFEWSVDAATPDDLTAEDAAELDAWVQSNPALGIRIDVDHVRRERLSMDRRTFAVERLGVGDWPRTDGTGDVVIDPALWVSLTDPTSEALDPVSFAIDVTPDRSRATIAAAGLREDGLAHVEIVQAARGTGWLVERVVELVEAHRPNAVVCDGVGPAGSLIRELAAEGVSVTVVTAKEHAQACGWLFDAVEQRTVRHRGEQSLTAAISGAAKRPLGDAWAWSRKNSAVDISPLVAATLALWAAAEPTVNTWVGWDEPVAA